MTLAPALDAAPTGTTVLRTTVASDLLGPLQVEPSEIFHFPAGLFGFADCRRFVLVPAERDGLFWLQSAEHPALIFLLTDPFGVFPGYSVELQPADRAELEVDTPDEVAVLAIVTLPRARTERPTANLQGPLALAIRSRRGKQIALPESDLGTRCAFDLRTAA